MAEPNTVNVALIIPNTGDLPGLWSTQAVNPDFVAIDGYLGGVVTLGATNAPIVLTAPSGSITPSPGPTQSQNRILKFTGALTGNVQVTFPLPGEYTIQNLTTGAFVLSFKAAGAGKIVATDQGSVTRIWNDGTDCWLILNNMPGQSVFLNGVSAVPAWVAACTTKPYLLEDGSIYNVADYPALGARLGSKFGGNGVSTFGVPDSRGRLKLAVAGASGRITTAGCGIDGNTIGAAADTQSSVLNNNNLPPYTPAGSLTNTNTMTVGIGQNAVGVAGGGGAIGATLTAFGSGTLQNLVYAINPGTIGFQGNAQGGTSVGFSNVPPAQVDGIWLIAT